MAYRGLHLSGTVILEIDTDRTPGLYAMIGEAPVPVVHLKNGEILIPAEAYSRLIESVRSINP